MSRQGSAGALLHLGFGSFLAGLLPWPLPWLLPLLCFAKLSEVPSFVWNPTVRQLAALPIYSVSYRDHDSRVQSLSLLLPTAFERGGLPIQPGGLLLLATR